MSMPKKIILDLKLKDDQTLQIEKVEVINFDDRITSSSKSFSVSSNTDERDRRREEFKKLLAAKSEASVRAFRDVAQLLQSKDYCELTLSRLNSLPMSVSDREPIYKNLVKWILENVHNRPEVILDLEEDDEDKEYVRAIKIKKRITPRKKLKPKKTIKKAKAKKK